MSVVEKRMKRQLLSDSKILDSARRVLDIEAGAVAGLRDRIDQNFVKAIQLIRECNRNSGRIVVSGMGKSGHIARKIASTLASTGTPAFFMHPAEASHGDLGMMATGDVMIALSNSGESEELLVIVPLVKRNGARLIAITGNASSRLAREADAHLDAAVAQEACSLGLAPTASTTAALALGDALAVTMLEDSGFTPEEFAMSHPGGSLGRRLLTHVEDVMRTGAAIPSVPEAATFSQALLEISRKGMGMTAIVDAQGRVAGIFTDGDLRRTLEKSVDLRTLDVRDVMHRDPRTVSARQLAAEAAQVMEEHRISQLLVVDGNRRLVGALNMHDLMQAKVI